MKVSKKYFATNRKSLISNHYVKNLIGFRIAGKKCAYFNLLTPDAHLSMYDIQVDKWR